MPSREDAVFNVPAKLLNEIMEQHNEAQQKYL